MKCMGMDGLHDCAALNFGLQIPPKALLENSSMTPIKNQILNLNCQPTVGLVATPSLLWGTKVQNPVLILNDEKGCQ